MVHMLVVTDDKNIDGGWISPTTVKMSPATIAERPAQRMRFEAVIFIFLFLSFVWRSICVTAIKGRPKSRTLLSKPCSAAWSITEPRMTVVPSLSW